MSSQENMQEINYPIYFAAIGDVHGDIYTMLGLLQNWEIKHQKKLSFVLQVGDFEPHRDLADLATIDTPTKYKKLGDFPDFYQNKAEFPYPIYFIGGNHEPYGFLDCFYEGKEIAKNFHYLGRVNLIELFGLRIVGVSGIYKESLFRENRLSVNQIDQISNKKYIGFTESEISQALDYERADILIMHEWANNIIDSVALAELQQVKNRAKSGIVGNEYARLLIEALKPKLVLFGHMHYKYCCLFPLNNEMTSNICCLANVKKGQDSLAVFSLDCSGIIKESVS